MVCRSGGHYQRDLAAVRRGADQVFLWVLLFQWAFAIAIAVLWSPRGWAGKVAHVHAHVWAATFLGAAINALPVALIRLRPGTAATRTVVTVAQMLWSALLIHLSGGRIETHFHVFGSLAFIAFYRDWKLLVLATVVVAADHLVRGLISPVSVYGIADPEWWRFLEHAGWVVFEDVVLVLACLRGLKEMRQTALRQAQVEEQSAALDRALSELGDSQEAMVRAEKLAAVGQLAASVGHELRNPLAAIRNAHAYVSRRLAAAGGELKADARVGQFMGVIERELAASSRIISDLLDFARERPPRLQPCPLRPLVDEAISVVPPRAHVKVVNSVPHRLPIPNLDKEQFRQVLVNLVQNAVEAIPADRPGEVAVAAAGGEGAPFSVEIRDDGAGIPEELRSKIFQPLFTTKAKGTGLGLAIVAGMVNRHGGAIRVESEVGRGTRFVIELPARAAAAVREVA